MNVLALDTSGPVAGVAVASEGLIRYEAAVRNGLTHSVNLMPMMEEALTRSGLALKDMDLIAVTVGPGSFTGVRLGVEAAKATAHVLDIPCLGVDALEATALNITGFEGVICPIQDARAQQVYGAAFSGTDHKRLMEDAPMPLTEYADAVEAFTGPLMFLGDGTLKYREWLAERFPEPGRVFFAPPEHSYLRPAAVAAWAMRHPEGKVSWQDLMPLYLRPPQAERQRNLVERAHG